MRKILENTDTRTLLSTLWLFVLFNIFFADFQWFVTTGAIEEILSGTVRGYQVTPNLLLIAALVHEIPVLMLLLSRVLTRNINRAFNIVAGVLNFFFAVSGGWTTPDQIFFKVVMAIGLLLIVWTAWRWPHPSRSLAKLESQRAKIVARASVGIALIGLLAAAPASSQKGGFELGVGAGLMSLGDKLGGDTGLSLDVRAGYFLTDRFEVELQGFQASAALEGGFRSYTLNAVYHLEGPKGVLPYVLLGVGTVDVELGGLLTERADDDGSALRAAAGARFRLGNRRRPSVRVELSALEEDSFGRRSTHLGLTCAFSWRFGAD